MYEVDFLPVGDASRSGDAIALRYQAPNAANGDWVVVVIDGGFDDDGEALVRHIRSYYRTGRVDLVVSTHPDADHVRGLHHVLEQLDVGELLVHDPRAHLTGTDGLALDAVLELIDLADRLGIPRTEPFAGLSRYGGTFLVAGPDEVFYRQLLSEQIAAMGRPAPSLAAKAAAAGRSLLRRLSGPPPERLTDAGVTSPRNESSAVCHVEAGQRRLLFTGDAGQRALDRVIEVLAGHGYTAELWPPALVQAPHHGSRRNAGPAVLDRLLGTESTAARGSCFVSAAADAERHPNPLVVNAFERRGYRVFPTSGRTICDHDGAFSRPNWTVLEPVGFVDDSAETDVDS